MAVAVECMCWSCKHWDLGDRINFVTCRCELLDRYTPSSYACMWSRKKRKEKRKEAHNETR